MQKMAWLFRESQILIRWRNFLSADSVKNRAKLTLSAKLSHALIQYTNILNFKLYDFGEVAQNHLKPHSAKESEQSLTSDWLERHQKRCTIRGVLCKKNILAVIGTLAARVLFWVVITDQKHP